MVLGAVDRRLGQHPGRLLEGGGRQERARVQARLGHTQQHGLRGRRLAALGEDPIVRLLELEAIDELRREQLGVTRRVHGHLAQHLANDDLDVLVVDRHALGPIHLLDLGHQEALDGVHALDGKQVLGVQRSLCDRVAG